MLKFAISSVLFLRHRAAALLACIDEVLVSTFGQEPGCSDRDIVVSLSPSSSLNGYSFRLGHPFQLVVYYSSHYSTLRSLDSVVKQASHDVSVLWYYIPQYLGSRLQLQTQRLQLGREIQVS